MIYEDGVLDMKKKNRTRSIQIPDDGYELQPQTLYLGRTAELPERIIMSPCLRGGHQWVDWGCLYT